jgi:transcriptional regulator with XRE-family HTH domain
MKFERKRREWSLQTLGALIGMQGSEISKVERGVLVPYPSQRERLARALGLDETVLLEEVPESDLEAVSGV